MINNTNTDNSSEDNTTTVPTTPTDQTYTGSAVCEPDEDGDFDAYDLTLEVVVSSDGKVKGIQNIKWSDKSMQSWYKDAEKKDSSSIDRKWIGYFKKIMTW